MPEELIGLKTIDCARYVVAQNPQISEVFFRGYNYIPNQPSGYEPRFSVNRDRLLHGFDPGVFLGGLDESFNVALDSRALHTGCGDTHFLMVDLAPSKNPDNQIKIEDRLKELIVPHLGGGFLLETNRSYQYFGFRTVDYNGWLDFLGRCLITSIVTKTPEDQPNIHEVIADYRYIGYSILRRSTGLRVTTKGSKVFEPRSIAIIQ